MPDGHCGGEGTHRLAQSLSELLNGRYGISPEMAIRLEKADWG